MIQRIQSVYWFLVIILMSVLLYMPLFNFGNLEFPQIFTTLDCKLLIMVCGVITAVSGLAIFMFKNRPLQLRLGYLNILNLLAAHLFVWAHYYFLLQGEAPAQPGDEVSILPWVAIPTVAFILNILAIKGVKADEKLVKSVDRLRD